MSDSYIVRFVGRFVFAYQGPKENPTSVVALAVDMTFNRDLGGEAHRVMLTAPRSKVEALGARRADLTLFCPSKGASEGAQILAWDLGGHDTLVAEGAPGGLRLNSWDDVPDVRHLSGGSFRRDVLSADRQHGPVACRFRIAAGSLTPVYFDQLKRVAFAPYGEVQPKPTEPSVPLPDAVEVGIATDGVLPLQLTRHGDGVASSIIILPALHDAESPVVVTITNLCTRPGADDDREFAAYYDLLSQPAQARRRLVPFNVAGPQMGRHADCTGIATLGH